MHKCYLRRASADDIAVFLRDAATHRLTVLGAISDAGWVGIACDDDGPLDAVAEALAARFGEALDVSADTSGWTLRIRGERPITVRSTSVSKDGARKAAQQVSQALALPRITTALERVLRRPLGGAAALERVGEALELSACGRTAADIAADAGLARLRVEGTRVIGRVAGSAAGAGYAQVGDLIEDTAADLLARGRVEAALRQLRAYDIVISLQDGELRCQAPQGTVTTGLRAALVRHRQAIIDGLS